MGTYFQIAAMQLKNSTKTVQKQNRELYSVKLHLPKTIASFLPSTLASRDQLILNMN